MNDKANPTTSEREAPPVMKCGHAANAYRHLSQKEADALRELDGARVKFVKPDGNAIHSCVICPCSELAEAPPDLAGRRARCAYYGGSTHKNECGKCGASCSCETDSDLKLPFFEFKGPGSKHAAEKCANCTYTKPGHFGENAGRYKVREGLGKKIPTHCVNNGKEFVAAGPAEFDEFYCGCHGWD